MVKVVFVSVVRVVSMVGLGVIGGGGSAHGSVGESMETQSEPTAEQLSLVRSVADRFEVVRLTEGLALSPKHQTTEVTLVELRDGTIAIDGVIVSGRDLRDRLGDVGDADLVIRLSYVDPALVPRLFGDATMEEARDLVGPVRRTDPDSVPESSVRPVEPSDTVEPDSERQRRRRTTRGDIVRFGGGYTVEADQRVRGDVVVIGGPVTVDGEVDGEVVVVAGRARFGPTAQVDGGVTVVGGRFDRASTAQLRGDINHVGLGDFDLSGLEIGSWSWRGNGVPLAWRPRASAAGRDLAGTVIRLLFYALLASVIVTFGAGSVERAAERTAAEPLKAGAVGFLAQLLLAPLFVLGVILLLVSIIGIPLLVLVPFAALAVCVIMLAGFAGSAHALGRWIRTRFGLSTHPIYVSVWAGIALILVPTMVGEVFDIVGGPFRAVAVLLALTGLLIEYAAWTAGFGAVVLNRFGPPLQPTPAAAGTGPPPSPPLPSANPGPPAG